ncbi:hypothetical protein CN934_22555 [Ensifer sp. MMN_5]|nr:hypothetical protein CN934_22555 [Ensifer sp. MMN_5]
MRSFGSLPAFPFAKWLQSALGVSSDGIICAGTLAAAAKADAIKTVKSMCAKRLPFLRALSIFSTFRKGWTSRVARVEAEAMSTATEARGISQKSLEIALTMESDNAAKSSKTGAASSAGSATGGGERLLQGA